MLSRCLNPACRAPFRYLHEGRIFNIERVIAFAANPEPQHLVEHYWLCGVCSMSLKVVVENGCVTTQPIRLELTAGETGAGKLIPVA